MTPQTGRELRRWYKLKDHTIQLDLVRAVSNGVRFPVVPAGRRSGKTERAKRFIAKEAMRNAGERYFIAAPTRDQVKKIYWQDMKLLCLTSLQKKAPSETDLIIHMNNGTEIHLIGLDKPERIEGVLWTGGLIDELDDVKDGAWETNIRPALDTYNPSRPDYLAWCWLIGVPDGLRHLYEFSQYAESGKDPDFKVYHWKSSDILPAKTIESAKRQMSAKQFRQEYEATFENSTGRIYEDYDKNNYTDARLEKHERLMLTCDFNYSPMSSAIAVRRGDDIYILEEIILTSAVAQQTAMEFVERYKYHDNKCMELYGDPAGKAGEKHHQESDFTSMERVLRDAGWSVARRVANSTLSIKAGQNSVRAKIANAYGERSLFVNPNTAPYVHKALATGTLKKGSAFLEEENEYQHVGTAVRYMVDILFPVVENRVGTARTPGAPR